MPSFLYPPKGGRALRARGKQRRRRCTNATPIFFPEKENGRRPSKRKAFRLAVSGLNDLCASGMRLPARGKAAFSIAIRRLCSYYPLLRSRKAAELPTAVQCAARAALQDKNCQCAGSRGKTPCLSLGVPKGVFSLEREYPLCLAPPANRGTKSSSAFTLQKPTAQRADNKELLC